MEPVRLPTDICVHLALFDEHLWLLFRTVNKELHSRLKSDFVRHLECRSLKSKLALTIRKYQRVASRPYTREEHLCDLAHFEREVRVMDAYPVGSVQVAVYNDALFFCVSAHDSWNTGNFLGFQYRRQSQGFHYTVMERNETNISPAAWSQLFSPAPGDL